MKKIGNIIVAVIVALCWGYFIYRFPDTGIIAKVLGLIILLPFTAKVVYSFLLEWRQKKDAAKEDELAKNFTPFSTPAATSNTENVRFCSKCGAKNNAQAKFCCGCGESLD